MTKPLVVIVGRQNMGKSTLLNRLAGKQIAITDDLPGTTRDRVLADVVWRGAEFTLVDTGGLELKPEMTIAQRVRDQVDVALTEADVIIFLVDVQDGVTPLDLEIAARLRPGSKPIMLVANKADNIKLESVAGEFYELSLGEPLAVSAHHGRGTAELLDNIIELLPAPPVTGRVEPLAIKVAIIGRPNVGKSMLLNVL